MATKTMSNKFEAITLFLGAGATLLAEELFIKIIMTTLAMLVGTTASFYYKKYLENKNKK